MNVFGFLSLRSRFLVAPSIGIFLMLILYFTSNAIIQSHSDLFKQLSDSNLPQVSQISRISVLLIHNHNELTSLLLSGADDLDEEQVYVQGRKILDELHRLEAQLSQGLSNSQTIVIDQVNIMAQIKLAFSRYRETVISAIELSTVDTTKAQKELLAANQVLDQLNKFFLILSQHYVRTLTIQSSQVKDSLYDHNIMTILSIVLVLFMVFFSLYFSKRMTSGLEQIYQALLQLNEGKTDVNLPEQTDTYLLSLTNAVARFQATLRKNKKQQDRLNSNIHELQDSKERYFNLLNLVPTAIIATDDAQNIVIFNKAAEKMFGYDSQSIINQPLEQLIPEQYRHQHKINMESFKDSDIESITAMKRKPVKALKKNAEQFYIEASIGKLKLAKETLMTVAITDITERLLAEEKILYQAHFDALTNLPNRFLSLDRLSQQLNEAQRKNELVAVAFLDLDDFKKINDSLGHEAGDKLLIEAARRLRHVVRSVDTVGRLGGDEFIIMLVGLKDPLDARPVVENLIAQFRKAFKIDGHELILTASVGISVFPDDGDNASQLLRNADSAMYYAKELGRNTYSYFTESMNQNVSRRLSLEVQMHGALERDEFRLLYQPQIDVTNGRFTGAEALLRWNNPVLGDVFPDEFIPIAEQTGLIVPIGNFVLRQALAMTQQWQQKYQQPFTMAVNLSPRQFRNPKLVSFIEQALHDFELSAQSLELEITEGVLMSGHAYTDEALDSLSKLGISIAMDDFGTGYSSLSYLRRYPFNVLKIDRSFVQDITEDTADRELVNAAIAMAHSLGLKVVAEGVETEAQLSHLTSQGCESAQGYLFSKAVSFEEITRLFGRQN